jgi:DNA-directed RNA polymerase alpha subunit
MEWRSMAAFIYNDAIDECELRYRCGQILKAHGFKSVLELAKMSDAEILRIKGIGKASLADIRMVIAAIEKERAASIH